MGQALRRGLADATRFPVPLIVMFAAYLAGALVFTLPVFHGLDQTLSHRLASGDMARTFDLLMLVGPSGGAASLTETGAGASGQPVPGQAEVLAGLLVMAAMLLALGLGLAQLASLPNALLSGGALQIYADGRFTWRRFLWGCWHWALPFTALMVVFGVVAAVIGLVGLGLAGALAGLGQSAWLAAALIPVGAVYVAAAAVFDYARAIAVSANRRNVFWALARAIHLVIHRPRPALGLYLSLVALGYFIIVVYNVAALLVPFDWALVAIGLQQACVAARLWARLACWASTLALYRGLQGG